MPGYNTGSLNVPKIYLLTLMVPHNNLFALMDKYIGFDSDGNKAVAGVIAPPQDQNGAAWAIERYALGALE